jgi:hypothetical protein
MPLMSAKVHPMAQVFPIEHLFNPFAMIIGSILLSLMNTYFRLSGKGFNSNSGACKIDGNNFLCESTKSTKTLPWRMVCKANVDSCMF